MLDEEIAAHQKRPKSRGRPPKNTEPEDAEIKTLVKNVGRKGIITRTKFNKATHCSGDAVIIFISPGSTGEVQGTDVFESASAIFGQHEVVEMKIPRLRNKFVPPRLDSIHLEGEEKGAVPVFDSCDEIRAKIESYLGRPDGPTRYTFCQALGAQLNRTIHKRVDTTQLKVFRAQKGSSAGARQIAYYAAYVYFEKLRIAEGRPKSLHRLEMEERYPHGLKCKRG